MQPLYANSPLIEAVCDFRFEPGEPWDATIPGRLYTPLRKEFPKRRAVQDFTASIVAGPERIEQQVTPVERIRFLREDETALIQVAVNNLTVNQLKPYPGWNVFLQVIRRALRTYNRIAEPRGLQRIGLRYINRIEVPGTEVDLESYFDFYPHIGPAMPQLHGDFLVGVAFPYRDGRDNMRVQLNGMPTADPSASTFMLDIEYFLNQSGDVPLTDAIQWIEDAHQRVEEVFEGAIKPRLREIFEPGGMA